MAGRFEVHIDTAGKHRFRLKSSNGWMRVAATPLDPFRIRPERQ